MIGFQRQSLRKSEGATLQGISPNEKKGHFFLCINLSLVPFLCNISHYILYLILFLDHCSTLFQLLLLCTIIL